MMQNQFIQPGSGRLLRAVTGPTGNTVDGERTTIEPGERSEVVAAHDGQELMFYFEFDEPEVVDPGSGSGSEESGSGSEEVTEGSVLIERVTMGLDRYDEHDEITIDGEASYSWAAGERLLGLYRVVNNLNVALTVRTNNSLQ